jgi:hypothetical protein
MFHKKGIDNKIKITCITNNQSMSHAIKHLHKVSIFDILKFTNYVLF